LARGRAPACRGWALRQSIACSPRSQHIARERELRRLPGARRGGGAGRAGAGGGARAPPSARWKPLRKGEDRLVGAGRRVRAAQSGPLLQRRSEERAAASSVCRGREEAQARLQASTPISTEAPAVSICGSA
jgi:hypothetical protein